MNKSKQFMQTTKRMSSWHSKAHIVKSKDERSNHEPMQHSPSNSITNAPITIDRQQELFINTSNENIPAVRRAIVSSKRPHDNRQSVNSNASPIS